MNWGKGIFIFYSLFVVAILSVVYFSFTQEVNLVAEDYYKQELAYEDQISRIRNTNKLANKPTLVLRKNFIELTFPKEITPKGNILFFRPSDSSKDSRTPIVLDANGTQKIDFSAQQQGKWIAKLLWSDGSKEYYQAFDFYLD